MTDDSDTLDDLFDADTTTEPDPLDDVDSTDTAEDDRRDEPADNAPGLMETYRQPALYVAGSVATMLTIAGLLGALYTTTGIVGTVIYSLAFLGGAALLPLLAYSFGDLLPGGGGLAHLLWMTCMIAVGRLTIVQTETDEYVVEVPDNIEPVRNWERFAMGKLGISYERSEEAFGDATVDDSLVRHSEPEPQFSGQKASGPVERGGFKTFIDLRASPEAVLVRTGEKLSELKNSAGTTVVDEMESEALAEFGGDTSRSSNKLLLVGSLTMALLGGGMGYMVFFL